MSDLIKFINSFFKQAIKEDVNDVKSKIILSERQEKIFEMFYIKRNDINFIADTLGVCPMVINNELKAIRKKIIKVIMKIL